MKGLAVAVALLVASCVVRVPTAPPLARICTFLQIQPDSVFIATYIPPCDASVRPPNDTIRNWRLKNLHPECPMQGIVDESRGEVRLHWDCPDNTGVRRVDAGPSLS